MRRVLAALIGLTVLSVAFLISSGTPVNAATPTGLAQGDVFFDSGNQHLAFSAVDYGPSGDQGFASYSNTPAGVSYTAILSCVNVDGPGKIAYFSYQIPAGNGALTGLWIVWKVTDGTPDTVGFSVAPDAATATSMCNSGFAPANSYNVETGNLTVQALSAGTGSTNSNNITVNTNQSVTVTNNSTINHNVSVSSNSGNNTSSLNTTTTGGVTTGAISHILSISHTVNLGNTITLGPPASINITITNSGLSTP